MADEFSGSESDDCGLQDDIEALKRACRFVGTETGKETLSFTANSDDSCSESDDGDRELLRKIQQRFSTPEEAQQPLNLKPICALPPVFESDSDDDCNDDFEILRAVQRRFTGLDNGKDIDSLNESSGDGLLKPQVGASVIDSEKETSNNFFTGRTNIAEEFPDPVEAIITDHVSESSPDIAHGSQSCDFFNESGAEYIGSPNSSFPKSAQAFIDAIKKNRACQKFLRSKLMQIESRIEENTKMRNTIKTLKNFQYCCRRRTGQELSQKKDARIELIQVPKQRANVKAKDKSSHVMYYGPAENAHVPNYRMVLQKNSVSLSRGKWTKTEDENLVKGIKQQFQDMLLQKTYQNAEISRRKSTIQSSDVQGLSGDAHDFDSIIALIGDHEITDENLRAFLPKVNWEQLASMYMKGRSGAECEVRWLNYADPLINKESWTNLEEKKLLHVVQQKGISNWINIAGSLGTNRTPFQCLAHYQSSLNPSILKRDWTEDEDDKLRAAVSTYGESNWQRVASVLEGRTGTQCSNRWTKSLHPIRKRIGKWSPDEDKRLEVAVLLFGDKNWRNIAQHVPGRNHVQCRERWRNCLDPSLKFNKWSEEEDLRLQEAYEEHGPCWNKIAACVLPRTDNQCLRRWKTLFPHEFPRLQAARKIRKVALISNFVDREARRPALGPSDFVQLQLLDSIPAKERNSHGKKKRKSSYVAKLRSKKCKRDGKVSGQRVLRLTNGDEVDSFSGDDENLRKQNGKKRCSTVRKSSRHVTSSVDKAPSTLGNVDEAVQTARKKAPRRKTKNSRSRQELSEAVTGSMHAATEPEVRARKLSSDEDGCVDIANENDESMRRVKATTNRKASRFLCKNNQVTEQLSEAEGNTNMNGIAVKRTKEALGPCLSEHSDISNLGDPHSSPSRGPESMITNDDVAEPLVRDNNDEIPLRCSTPDILDNLNSRPSPVGRKNKCERSSSKGRTRSKQIQDTHYEDDMTLASFIKQSRKAEKLSLSAKVLKSSRQHGRLQKVPIRPKVLSI